MPSNIGLKLANGDFYSLVEENSSIKKKLVLTTVHDNQSSMQIDLYRSHENDMADAQYIGSLVIEKIMPKPKGEPSIEMVISSNEEGQIIADAVNLDAGPDSEHYILTVSLKSLDESNRDMEIPDFELDSQEETPSLYNEANNIRNKKRRNNLILLIILILLLLALAAWILFFGGKEFVSGLFAGNKNQTQTETVQPQSNEPARQEQEPAKSAVNDQPKPIEPAKPSEPTVVITAPKEAPAPVTDTSDRRRPPVASYNVPAVIPREGVNYTIRWGDTLWDISEAFYRNPWLYPRIAEFNNIRNPDLIISGRTIKIPPRN